MDSELLGTVGKIAGIGGIALGVFLLIFRDVIKKNIFPNLSQTQAYRIILLIVVLTFFIAAAGIAAWVFVQASPRPTKPEFEQKKTEASPQAPVEPPRKKPPVPLRPTEQPRFALKPLGKSTVEVWYTQEGVTDSIALDITKRLESVGAKVSLKLYKEPHPIPMETFTVYYRDPSNLEAAIQAAELLGDRIKSYRASIGLPTPNADLTILLPSMP